MSGEVALWTGDDEIDEYRSQEAGGLALCLTRKVWNRSWRMKLAEAM